MLFIHKESTYLKMIEKKRKGIALSEFEMKQAMIELKKLKEIYAPDAGGL